MEFDSPEDLSYQEPAPEPDEDHIFCKVCGREIEENPAVPGGYRHLGENFKEARSFDEEHTPYPDNETLGI